MHPSASATSPASFHLEPPPPPTAGVAFWPRVGARMLDWLPGMVLGGISGAMGGLLCAAFGVKLASDSMPTILISMPTSLASAVALSTLCETYAGGTIGKLLLGLRVTRTDGTPITLEQGLKRNVAYLWDACFFGLVAHGAMQQSPLQQRVGDRWAQTLVVRADEANLHVRRTVGVVAAALAGGFACASLVQTVGYVLEQIAFG